MTAPLSEQRVFPLSGTLMHYTWGGDVFLPALLGLDNREAKPCAEYWLGVHPNGPSRVHTERGEQALDAFLRENPAERLGLPVYEQFGALPFLFKVLDVAQMLSIQVHPDRQQGLAGFEKEEAAGIPFNAPHRNYKDPNHKPEAMIALSPFWLLHGFRNELALQAQLDETPELRHLLPLFGQGDYRGLYRTIMELPQQEVNRRLQPLANRVLPLYREGALNRRQPDFWAARAVETFCADGNFDRGLFSIYFFNLVHVPAGQGIYQAAGLPHAYLEGQCVEVMANSDNVLRAGLTPKHCDVPELLRLVRFEATEPMLLRRRPGTCSEFPTPAAEFALSHCQVAGGERHFINAETPTIVLITQGEGTGIEEGRRFPMQAGSAFYCCPGSGLMIGAASALSVFTASVPGV